MSHRDRVEEVPPGFDVIASTSTCPVAAMAHREKPLLAVQFHPEVVHTRHGSEILARFLFDVCHCQRDWNPKDRVAPVEDQIRKAAAERNDGQRQRECQQERRGNGFDHAGGGTRGTALR